METFSIKHVINIFGQKRYKSTYSEIIQLHQRAWFKPINVSNLNLRGRKILLESKICFSGEKGGRIKARTGNIGSVKRAWMQKEVTSSPNAYLKSIILTTVIHTKECRDVENVDMNNFLIQTPIYSKPVDEKS